MKTTDEKIKDLEERLKKIEALFKPRAESQPRFGIDPDFGIPVEDILGNNSNCPLGL